MAYIFVVRLRYHKMKYIAAYLLQDFYFTFAYPALVSQCLNYGFQASV